ncbi:hypothetical protein MBLNU230_g6757t1 [Neophaeotheca triangularis]
MATPGASGAQSLAATRLARQNKRIAAAEAALNGPPPPAPAAEKPRQARAKGKQWKPFDFSTDSVAPDNFAEGVPVSRINVFRAPSHDDASSRPMSRMSTVTTDTAVSENGLQEATHDDAGFQLITGKKKKHTALDAYEHPSSHHTQATVEAPFDKREIHQVFGNELPGPEFIEQTPGTSEGQVQFLQHPNGDIAAHQWSISAFQWQNIGHFSNIRKKIEGQLAGDTLKGETADLTLQKNTLAYFHTLAKQREAKVMDLQFGLKEIQALMPDFRIAAQTTPPHLPPPKRTMVSTLNARASEYEEPPQTAVFAPRLSLPSAPRAMEEQLNTLQPSQQKTASQWASFDQSWSATQSQHAQSQYRPRQEDPFYDNYYAAHPTCPHPYAPTPQPVQANHYGAASAYPGYGNMNFTFQYPARAPTSYQDSFAESQTQFYGGGQYQGQGVANSMYNHTAPSVTLPQLQRYNSFGNTLQQQRVVPQTPRGNISHGTERPHPASDPPPLPATNSAILAALPKPVAPLQSRAAMREHLVGLGDKAKERSLSQANIARTVTYESFPGQAGEEEGEQIGDQKADVPLLQSNSSALSSMLPTATPFDPRSDGYFPTLAPQHRRDPSSQVIGSSSDYLKNSSPDTNWESKGVTRYEIQTPPGLSGVSKPRIQDFRGPFFTEQSDWLQRSLDEALSEEDKKALYHEDLKGWWTDNNRFGRQEQAFQDIMESNKPSRESSIGNKDILSRILHGRKASSHLPLADFGPIGRPSTTSAGKRKEGTKEINQDLSRMLFAVAENLASYVSGSEEARRPHFQRWVQPPVWCIDSSATGNDSFYDRNPVQAPATSRPGGEKPTVPDLQFADFSSPLAGGVSVVSDEGVSLATSEAPKIDRFNLGGW